MVTATPCGLRKRFCLPPPGTKFLTDSLPDGSYSSVLVNPKIRGKARQELIAAARAGDDLGKDKARRVRVVEYQVPDRDGDGKGEVIALVTTITEMAAAPAPPLAQAYHQPEFRRCESGIVSGSVV